MKRFWALVWVARPIYWLSGFVFLGGIGVWLFSADKSLGWKLTAAGAAMWAIAKVLVFVACWLLLRLPEDEQDAIDPYRDMRGYSLFGDY